MSFRRPSRSTRIVLASVLAAPAVAVAWWLGTRTGQEPSAYEAALDRALAPVLQQRDLQLKWSASSSAQARLLARELAANSVAYLGPRDLELWQSLRLQVARASPAAQSRSRSANPST